MSVKITQDRSCKNLYLVEFLPEGVGEVMHINDLKALQKALNEKFKVEPVVKDDGQFVLGKDDCQIRIGDRIQYDDGMGYNFTSTVVAISKRHNKIYHSVRVSEKIAGSTDDRWWYSDKCSLVTEKNIKTKPKKRVRCPLQKGDRVVNAEMVDDSYGIIKKVTKNPNLDRWSFDIEWIYPGEPSGRITTDSLSTNEIKNYYRRYTGAKHEQ